MSSTDAPSEEKELDLVGKLELRIALADSDSKLQTLLSKFLCPLLLKLASPHQRVRDKVISICQHINARTKTPSLQLPVGSLIAQYKATLNSLVRHFDLLYISQGLTRVPEGERGALLPSLLQQIASNYKQSPNNTAILFNVFLRILPYFKVPQRGSTQDSKLREWLGLSNESSEDISFLTLWIGKTILFSTSLYSRSSLSTSDVDFLQLYGKPDVWEPKSGGLAMVETKFLLTKFLASGAFTDAERFMPALFASADGNSRISDLGEDMLKRATPAISLEDEQLVLELYAIYLGDSERLAARAPLQMKVIGLLCKSRVATDHLDRVMEVIQTGLAPATTIAHEPGPQKRGLESSKLRRQVFKFTNWVAQSASPSMLDDKALVLVEYLRDHVESQGWPRFNVDTDLSETSEVSSRSFCYESIGLIARACPRQLVLESNLDLLRWLFRSLGGDTTGNDTAICIEGALASVVTAVAVELTIELQQPLVDLLHHYASIRPGDIDASGTTIVRSTRYVALRYANRCLPFHNVGARRIDLIALSDKGTERREVIEEATKGLDPFWYRQMSPVLVKDADSNAPLDKELGHGALPDPSSAMDILFSDPTMTRSREHSLSHAIAFCRSILLHYALSSADRAPIVDVDWQKNLDALITNDEAARISVQKYLESHQDQQHQPLHNMIAAGFATSKLLTADEVAQTFKCLLEICSLGPSWVIEDPAWRIIELKPIIQSSNYSARSSACQIFGLVGAQHTPLPNEISKLVLSLWETACLWDTAVGQTVHEVFGSVVALGSLLCRIGPEKFSVVNEQELSRKFSTLVTTILCCGTDRDMIDAAITAFDQLSIFDALDAGFLTSQEGEPAAVIEKLETYAKAGNEKAVNAIGHLAMRYPEDLSQDSPIMGILEKLYKLHEQRQPELQFAVGAALSCAVGSTKSIVGAYSVNSSPPSTASKSDLLDNVLDTVLECCKQTKPALRQASAIWLLCLTQYCGHLPNVESRLRVLQLAFMSFLADKESLNQETASRGLALVYEKGDRTIKDELIRDLVGSFTSSKSNLSGNVSRDTQLFEPGALPTGDGSVTTYKDIISLANEVGDPSLIYRFMSLASSSSIWSSRAAFGRFGLSKILSDSSTNGYLTQNKKLYPALFRYRFDPNTNVKSAMNEIWRSLVADPRVTIETNFALIMEDLLQSILAREWRTREASCAAISDLLQGAAFTKYEPYLTRIWTVTFKVCDDIKDSVRKAAMSLARTLTGILTRSFDSGDSSTGTTAAMLSQVLPFLLSSSGLESGASDVQHFALATLLDIIKKGDSKMLRPYIGELVGGHLLPLLSSLEPEAINYIHLNADKYGMTEQQIDDARLSGVRMSPMMEAIERCLDMLDDHSMKDLVPHLTNATKTVIGLPSKVGVSRVLVSLSTRRVQVFKPYADGFLKLLRRHALDRNDSISASASAACGYLCRIASDEEVLKHVAHAEQLYFESEDERPRIVSGELMIGLAKHATDRVQNLSDSILPFIFLAMHDTCDAAKDNFKEAWEEGLASARTVKLVLPEIVKMATKHIESPRWSVKHASALAIAASIQMMGRDISLENSRLLWPAIEKAIGGKTWDGKEKVLEAFLLFIENSSFARDDHATASATKKIMIREAKRNNTGAYRRQAMASLGKFTSLYPSENWFSQVMDITSQVLDAFAESASEMDIDAGSKDGASSKTIKDETYANVVNTLLTSVSPSLTGEAELEKDLIACLDVIQTAEKAQVAIVHDAILQGERELFQRLDKSTASEMTTSTFLQFLGSVKTLQANVSEPTRTKAAEALCAMATVAAKNDDWRGAVGDTLGEMLTSERSPFVREILLKAKTNLGRPSST